MTARREPGQIAAEYSRYRASGTMAEIALAAHGADYCGQTSSATYAEVREALAATDIAPGEWLVDAGCGNGCFAVTLAAELGCHVCGIDVSADLVDVAERRAREAGLGDRCRFLAADFSDVAAVPGPVAVVLSVGSLYWGPSLGEVIDRWRSLLRPGGSIVIMANLCHRPLDDEEQAAVGHTAFIPEADIVEILERASFRVTRQDRTERYSAWLDRWCRALEERRAALERDLGAEGAAAMARRFLTYRSLAEQRKVLRVVLLAELIDQQGPR